jgi:phenylacetate-CoA ligase
MPGDSGASPIHFSPAARAAHRQPAWRDRLLGRVIDWYVRRVENNPNARLASSSSTRAARQSKRQPDRLAAIQHMQSLRLRRLIRHAAQNSPYYRTLFAASGLRADDIRGIDDLQRLPFTTPDDFRNPEEFLAVTRDRIAHIFRTCGTTKKPKSVYLTKDDFARCCNLVAAMGWLETWKQERPICMIYKQQGLWGSVNYVEGAVSRMGGLSLGIGVPSLGDTLDLMQEFQPNMLATNPCRMAALTRYAQRNGFHHPLKAISLGGEIVTAEQSNLFRDYWGAEVSNGYGLLEIGGVAFGSSDCGDTLHFNLLHNVPEIVDPETGEPADEGELILTTLVNEAMPLIRYRTRDRVRRVVCRCGWNAPAFQVIARVNDSTVVAANNIHGPLVADAIAEVEPQLTGLEIVAEHVEGVDKLTMRVNVLPDSTLQVDDVRRQFFKIFPVMDHELRVGAYELMIELVRSHELPPKFLRVRDLRM